MTDNPSFMAGVPELLILRLLQDREMYGYEIVAAIAAATGRVVVPKEGVVYPLLHALEKEAALRAQPRPADGRIRIYYTLTSKGVRRLFDLTDQWTRMQAGCGAGLVLVGLAPRAARRSAARRPAPARCAWRGPWRRSPRTRRTAWRGRWRAKRAPDILRMKRCTGSALSMPITES